MGGGARGKVHIRCSAVPSASPVKMLVLCLLCVGVAVGSDLQPRSLCRKGYYRGHLTRKCAEGPPGKFRAKGADENYCEDCPHGWYQALPGEDVCWPLDGHQVKTPHSNKKRVTANELFSSNFYAGTDCRCVVRK